jgi:hypothetical protein
VNSRKKNMRKYRIELKPAVTNIREKLQLPSTA